MADDLDKHFLAIISCEVPKDAELYVHRESGSICVYADWQLGNDPARPNKRSKKIKICIDEAAVDDYADGDDGNRKSADQRLRKIVATQLQMFNPDHSSPAHVPVPIEQWTITTHMLNA
jgi:hypothetical protein